MDLGKRLKAYRLSKDMSQEDLSSKAGINDKYYGRIERNESCPTIDKLSLICSALGIDIVEFFLYEISKHDDLFFFNQEAAKIIIEGLKKDIDIHFNRDIMMNGCENCIWYNGFIGSMSFDEFELQLFAVGNIRGTLYIDYKEVLELNKEDISQELRQYIANDIVLEKLIEYMPYDKKVLSEKEGNAFFVVESNWLSAQIINNETGEVQSGDIIFDTDSILKVFKNTDALIKYIFQ